MTMAEKMRKLSLEEQLAVTQARQYRAWRKRLLRSRSEHNAHRPRGISPEVWDAWYDTPYGHEELNRRHQTARRLLQEGRI